jgi:hypothetical protein
MVNASKTKKTVQARAKIAHKLSKYIRSQPIHLPHDTALSHPSTTHLLLGGPPKRKYRNTQNTWYPADEEKDHFKRKRNTPRPATPRHSITPGTIAIILTGPHRGRRAVVLKHLPLGRVLLTGPYAINGVPLKRVHSSYLIATQTKVPLDGVADNID